MRIIQTGFYFPGLKCVPRATFFFHILFCLQNVKMLLKRNTRITYIITSVTYNRMSKDLFLNALCPSVRGDSSARRIPYLEKQLVREVLSISVSVLKKKENNMYLRVEDVGTYCARCFLDYSYTGVTCCSVCMHRPLL